MSEKDVESIYEWVKNQVKELSETAQRWKDNEMMAKEARKAIDMFMVEYEQKFSDLSQAEKGALQEPAELRKSIDRHIEDNDKEFAVNSIEKLDEHELIRQPHQEAKKLHDNLEKPGAVKSFLSSFFGKKRDVNLNHDNVEKSLSISRSEHELPASITKQYLITDGKFFDKNNPQSPIFKDIGKNLVTSSNDKQVIASMILVAQAKGWDELKISGTKEFRQAAWLEAESLGIRTKGYTPSEKDIALLNDLKERRSINKIERKVIEPEPEKLSDKEQPYPGQGRFQVVEYLGSGKSRVLLATDSAKEADKVFKAGIDRRIVDTVQEKTVGEIDWVRDGSSPQWEHRYNFDELLKQEAEKDTSQDLKSVSEPKHTIAKEHQEIFNNAPPLVQASIAAIRNVLNKNFNDLPAHAKQFMNEQFNVWAAEKVKKGDFKDFPPPLVQEKFKANLPSKNAEKDRAK